MLDHDWLKHPSVRQLSPEARGVFCDLILLSRLEGESQNGILTQFDLPLTLDEIARHIHTDKRYLRRILPPLKQADLVRESPRGFYIPKVVRQANQHKRRVENGRKGGNPKLLTQRDTETTLIQPDRKRRPVTLSPHVQRYRKYWKQFSFAYPRKKELHLVIARSVFEQFVRSASDDELFLMIDHLLNRKDPLAGDIVWIKHPEKIPDPATFIRKKLWKKSYRSVLEATQ